MWVKVIFPLNNNRKVLNWMKLRIEENQIGNSMKEETEKRIKKNWRMTKLKEKENATVVILIT